MGFTRSGHRRCRPARRGSEWPSPRPIRSFDIDRLLDVLSTEDARRRARRDVKPQDAFRARSWLGFHAGILADVAGHLDGAETTLIDLGFVSGGPKGERVAVGRHRHRPFVRFAMVASARERPLRALVSIQGFDCFCCHIAPQRIAALKRGLEREPGATLQAFWRSCGARASLYPKRSMSRGSTKGSIG